MIVIGLLAITAGVILIRTAFAPSPSLRAVIGEVVGGR